MQAHTQKRANLSIGGMKNQHYSILTWNQQVTLDKYIRSFDWIRGSNNSAVLTSIYAFPCLYAYIQKSLCTVTHARTQTIANWRTHAQVPDCFIIHLHPFIYMFFEVGNGQQVYSIQSLFSKSFLQYLFDNFRQSQHFCLVKAR